MCKVFDYQKEVYKCFTQSSDNIIIVQPTGSGKTACCVNLTGHLIEKSRRSVIWIGISNVVLADQWKKYYPTTPSSIITGRNPDVTHIHTDNISIMTYEHLLPQAVGKNSFQPDLIIMDEVQLIFDGRRGMLVKILIEHCISRNVRCVMISGSLDAGQIVQLCGMFNNISSFTSFSYPYRRYFRIIRGGEFIQHFVKAYVCTRFSGYRTIIFTSSKNSTISIARSIVKMVDGIYLPVLDKPPLPERTPFKKDDVKFDIVRMGTYGIVVHYRGIGKEYSDYVVESMNNGKSNVLVCTSTMKEGIDIPNIKYVFITNHKHLTTYDVKQMIGRGYRTSSSLTFLTDETFDIYNTPSNPIIPSNYHPFHINLHFPDLIYTNFHLPPSDINNPLIKLHGRIYKISYDVSQCDPILTVLILSNYEYFSEMDSLSISLITFAVHKQDIVDNPIKIPLLSVSMKVPSVDFKKINVDGIVLENNIRKCAILYSIIYSLLMYGREEYDQFIYYTTPACLLVSIASHVNTIHKILSTIGRSVRKLESFRDAIYRIISFISVLSDMKKNDMSKRLSPISLVESISWWKEMTAHYNNRHTEDDLLGLGYFDHTISSIQNLRLK